MPMFSILTPTHNRKDFLPKLILSLTEQTFQDFEWIVADDGSKDGTDQLFLDCESEFHFPFSYIKSDLRVGKSKMDNILLDNAIGDYILWCDSDDYFLENSFSKFESIIKNINLSNRQDIIGIIAQNVDLNGMTQTFNGNDNHPPDGIYSWEEIEKFMVGDGTICLKKEVFENQRWPEIDFLVIESILLRKLYKSKKFFFTSNIVKVMDRSAENSVSHGKKMQYCRGSAHAIAGTVTEKKFSDLSLIQRIKCVLNYFRYSIHGDIDILNAIKLWSVLNNRSYLICIYPISYFLGLFDLIRNKVEKTHLEFDHNKDIASITLSKFNYD